MMNSVQRAEVAKELRPGGAGAACHEGARLEDAHQLYLFALLGRNALVVGMCACAAWMLMILAGRIATGPYRIALLLLCTLIAIDALYVGQKNRNMPVLSREWFVLNAARWAIIIVVIKLIGYLGRSPLDLMSDLPLLQTDPLTFFATPEFLLSLVAVVAIWMMGRVLGGDLAHLTLGERLMEIDPSLGVQTDRANVRQQLVGHVFAIGVVIALVGGVANWLAGRNSAAGSRADGFSIGADLVIYFALGLALIGIAQLTILRTGWLWERTPMSGNLVKRWTLYGLLFVGGLAALTFVLPFGYSAGLLPTLAYWIGLLGYGAQILGYLAYVLLGLILLPFALLLSLFRAQPPALLPEQAPPPPPPEPSIGGLPIDFPPWYQVLQSLIFWAIILILLGYAANYFLLQHQGVRKALRELPIVIWLREGWRGLFNLLRGIRNDLKELRQVKPVDASLARSHAPSIEPGVDPRKLPLREQIRLAYLDLLQRAREIGIPRRESQTPYEFANKLTAAAPKARADIEQVTAEFVEARYSEHDVTSEHVSLARRCVERIEGALRRDTS
jgi:hypothetical protein